MTLRRALPLLAIPPLLAACSELTGANAPTGFPGPPVVTRLTADPDDATKPGERVTLSWEVTGQPTSLVLEPGVGSVSGLSAQVAPTATTTYTLTAGNAQGTHSAEVTVTVRVAEPPEAPAPGAPDDIPLGNWAFAVTASGGELTTGVVALEEAFTYGEYRGVWGDVSACSGDAAVCAGADIGGVFRSAQTGTLYFAVGTPDYERRFVGKDADGAFADDRGLLTVQGAGVIGEGDEAEFEAQFTGE